MIRTLVTVLVLFSVSAFADTKTSLPYSQVIQVILDHPNFTQYLHPNVKGRVPILVYGSSLPLKIEGKKFGREIIRADDSKPPRDGIHFETFKLTPDTANVSLRYPVEGVEASFILKRKAENWIVVDAKIMEY